MDVEDLQPGERLVHDAVVSGILGMGWWATRVEHPPAEAWAKHLNQLSLDQCGCGKPVCYVRHGVRLLGGEWFEQWQQKDPTGQRVPCRPQGVHVLERERRFWSRSRGGTWEPIPYAERVEWLQELIGRPRPPRVEERSRPDLNRA